MIVADFETLLSPLAGASFELGCIPRIWFCVCPYSFASIGEFVGDRRSQRRRSARKP